MNYTKTKSKNFFDHEIIGVINLDGRKVIYLKPQVKCNWRYNDHLIEEHMDHLNQRVLAVKRLEYFFKHIMGIDEPEN